MLNLSAADTAKRLEEDGGRFELQALVPLGGPAGHTRVCKFEVRDCDRLWIRTPFGWHQASDFEIRDYPPPRKKLSFELILPLADGDEEAKPVVDDKPNAKQRRAAEAAARKAEKDEAKAKAAEDESKATNFLVANPKWMQWGMRERCAAMCATDYGIGSKAFRRVYSAAKARLEQLANTPTVEQ